MVGSGSWVAQESSPDWESSLLLDIFDRFLKLGQTGVQDSPSWPINDKRSSAEFSNMAIGACGATHATVRYQHATVPCHACPTVP